MQWNVETPILASKLNTCICIDFLTHAFRLGESIFPLHENTWHAKGLGEPNFAPWRQTFGFVDCQYTFKTCKSLSQTQFTLKECVFGQKHYIKAHGKLSLSILHHQRIES